MEAPLKDTNLKEVKTCPSPSPFAFTKEEKEALILDRETPIFDSLPQYPRLKDLIYLELLSDDLYTTFKATYQGKSVVVKFYTYKSDRNNEYEILEYLEKHSPLKDCFPRPWFKYDLQEESLEIYYLEDQLTKKYTPEELKDTSSTKDTAPVKRVTLEEVYKVIVYEYIEGETIRNVTYNRDKVIKDITIILEELHRLNLVHSDLNLGNILRTLDNRYLLIDFGSAFSITDKKFPPLEFMVEEDEVPTQADDYAWLAKLK
jgi:serine/threonine protein kinase